VLTALRGVHGICVVIKVHPADSEVAFERLAITADPSGGIAVIGQCDLDALLGEASLLICQRSNIVITAAILGTPTLVCDFSTSPRILDFVEEGVAAGCPTPADIGPLVHRYVFDSDARRELLAGIAGNLHRFNGPNDGHSADRISSALCAAIGRNVLATEPPAADSSSFLAIGARLKD
jgi:hypothetical protein